MITIVSESLGMTRILTAVVRELSLSPSFYTNLHDDTEKKTWGNYAGNYPRLAKTKAQYDPQNLFRLNANIKPESA